MDYSMNVTEITLGGRGFTEVQISVLLLTFTVYMMIVCFNISVIFVIYTNERLHEPMYVFIAALLCNALFGSTAFYPKLLIDLLSKRQTSSYYACIFQGFVLYTYATSEFTLLSAMAYDRYVSICKPLQYSTLVGVNTVKKLLFLSWFLPSCELGVGLILTSRLQPCKHKVARIYCDNYSIVKLSCKDTSVNNMYGLFIFSVAVFPPVAFIIYSYVRILTVCLRNSKAFRRKALQTCLPHLIIFINFLVNVCFEVINSRMDSNQIPHIMAMIMSIEYLLIPPLFNPIVYRLKLQEIFNSIMRLAVWKRKARVFFRPSSTCNCHFRCSVWWNMITLFKT